MENYFLFAHYFALRFCFPQGESHLDRISVNSHVVIHVNSFTECAFRRASHEGKCEMCRCFSILVVSMLRLFSWPVQMLLTASKMLNCVVIWVVPVLSVSRFRLFLNYLSVILCFVCPVLLCLSQTESHLPRYAISLLSLGDRKW